MAAFTNTVEEPGDPGWTRYASINAVRDVAFALDGRLWALTEDGLVLWDVDAETYTRFLIQAAHMALAPDGTVWLGTEYGLCRFDGGSCQNYLASDGSVPDTILAMAVTPDGVLWLGTAEGVSRFDGVSWQSYHSPVATEDLAVSADGELWAATSGGVGRYLPAQDMWLTYTEEHGLPDSHAWLVAAGPDGDLWVEIAWEGVYRYDGMTWQPIEGILGGFVGDIAFASDGTPWVGTVGGTHYPGGSLAYLDGDGWVDVTAGEGLISLRAVALGPGDMVSASTNLGLGVYERGQWRLLKDGPTGGRVTALAVTPDGAAWFAFGDHSVANPGGGLSRFDGKAWEYYLEDAEVNALAVAPDGLLWAGVGSELVRYDGSSWVTLMRAGEDLPFGSILDIAFTRDGTAWVANGLSLGRFDGNSWTVYDRMANSIVAAPDGAVWIAGWEGTQGSTYVARFDGEDWAAYRLTDSFPGGFGMGVVTPDGLVWGVVADRGLASFDGRSWSESSSWSFYAPPADLGSRIWHILALGPEGALWVRTDRGVVRFVPPSGLNAAEERSPQGEWTLFAGEHGPIGHYIGPVAFGPEGEVWFGAVRYQPAQGGW